MECLVQSRNWYHNGFYRCFLCIVKKRIELDLEVVSKTLKKNVFTVNLTLSLIPKVLPIKEDQSRVLLLNNICTTDLSICTCGIELLLHYGQSIWESETEIIRVF